MIVDLYQQGRIHEAEASANRAASKAEAVHERLASQERRIERLALHCQAMWEMLRERAQFTEEEFVNKVLEVDLRDGRTDGRMAAQITDCPNCKQKTNSRRATCVICGVELPRPHAFQV
jgi:hypothetical protein